MQRALLPIVLALSKQKRFYFKYYEALKIAKWNGYHLNNY